MKFYKTPKENEVIYLDNDSNSFYLVNISNSENSLLWACELKNLKYSIELSEFYSEDCCFAYDVYGKYYHIDFKKQKYLLICDYDCDYRRSKIIVNYESKSFYILYEKDYEYYIQTWDLQSFKCNEPINIIKSSENNIDHKIYFSSNMYLSSSSIIYIKSKKDRKNNLEYLICINMKNKEIKSNIINFVEESINLNINKSVIKESIMIIPTVNDLEIINDSYIYKLDVFDLNTKKLIRTLDTRLFLIEDFDNENEKEIKEELLELISSIHFSLNEESIWVSWKDGSFRKFLIDGTWMSPLYKSEEGKILSCNNNLVLVENASISQISFPLSSNIDLLSSKVSDIENISFEMKYYSSMWNLTSSEKENINRFGKNVIEVNNLEDETSLLIALKILVLKSKDFDSLLSCGNIIFLFIDEYNQMNEKKFFSSIIKLDNSKKDMEQILLNFIKYKKSDSVYGEYSPALAFCALELALSDISYLKILSSYLNSIDIDHEFFFQNEGLEILMEKYEKCKEWEFFYKSLPYPLNIMDEEEEYEFYN